MTKIIRKRRTPAAPSIGKLNGQDVGSLGPHWREGMAKIQDLGFSDASVKRTYLGIDASYSGFAVAVVSEDPDASLLVQAGASKANTRGLFELERFLVSFVGEIHEQAPLRQITMEDYSPGAKFGRERMGELGGMVKMSLVRVFGWKNRLAYPTLPTPNEVKKFVTGKGQGKKDRVMMGVYKKWGIEAQTDNMADAYGLARMAYHLDDENSGELLQYETEVVTKLRDKLNSGYHPYS